MKRKFNNYFNELYSFFRPCPKCEPSKSYPPLFMMRQKERFKNMDGVTFYYRCLIHTDTAWWVWYGDDGKTTNWHLITDPEERLLYD